MLTAARLRAFRGEDGLLALLRDLGYPCQPVDVATDEWRRAGVVIEWNGEARLRLVARFRRLDVFLLAGTAAEESIATFLRTYRQHNQLTKSVIMFLHDIRDDLSIYDLAAGGVLRRFDVDLANPSAHSVDRLNLLAIAPGDDAALPQIFDRALDRETVTREFFQRFRAAVSDVADALAERCPGEERDAIDGEALLILSRLLFLSFVQVKGWLNGERRFLVDRLDRAIRQRREFFTTVLMPLFFGALNTPQRDRAAGARRLGRIPYLNGGLFEPSPFELRHANVMTLPNDLMRRVIDDVFEKFDFSIDERGSASTHVDPEMLGKVFESLMAGDERARSGSFYTPRPIVDALTERAIAEWLGDGGVEKLERIAVLDPACGSGAFLLSALGVIERLYRKLSNDVPHDLRRRIVERSLFGVDLEPEAVRLCELRLWLAIVSDSDDDVDSVEPLPNLDRNILQGNSLLSPTDFLGDARADLYRDWLQALRAQRDLIDRYRSAPRTERPALARLIRENDRRLAAELLGRAIEAAEGELRLAVAPQRDLFGRVQPYDHERCRVLQERIAEHRRALDRVEDGTLDFFSFDVHFAHVRFDVVASNPPWVRNSRIDPAAKRMYSDRYAFFRGGSGTPFHQPDLSIAFFERATSLVANDGVIAMLMPAKIANAAYATTLRRAARDRMSIVEIIDWSDDPQRWFDADTFPMGIVVRPSKSERPIRVTTGGETFDVRYLDDEWSLVPPRVDAILRRIAREHRPLEDALNRRPMMGVKTGDNRTFFLEAKRLTHGHLITTDGVPIPLAAVCRCVRGRDVRRWRAEASQWMLWPPAGGWSDAPKWLTRLAEARNVGVDAPQLAFVRAEHVGIKVVWKDLSRGMAAAVLSDVVHIDGQAFPLVPNQTLYSLDAVTLDEAYALAALLNSTIADALLLRVAERAKDAHFRYFGRTVGRMPLPPLEQERLVRLSRRAHHGADVQEDVDRVVASLYGVSAGELEVLRAFVARRLGAR